MHNVNQDKRLKTASVSKAPGKAEFFLNECINPF